MVRCTWHRKRTRVAAARVPSALRHRITPRPTPHRPLRGVRRRTRSGLTGAILKTVRRWDPQTTVTVGAAYKRLRWCCDVGGRASPTTVFTDVARAPLKHVNILLIKIKKIPIRKNYTQKYDSCASHRTCRRILVSTCNTPCRRRKRHQRRQR